MTLNEKIGIILKQHKEGEEFFNALARISCFVRTGYSLMIPII